MALHCAFPWTILGNPSMRNRHWHCRTISKTREPAALLVHGKAGNQYKFIERVAAYSHTRRLIRKMFQAKKLSAEATHRAAPQASNQTFCFMPRRAVGGP